MRQLRRPGGPSASACREAGATVARNVALADMNIADAVLDGRRIEIVANGLHAYHGQQLAIDTTCVSPLTRTGQPHPGTTTEPGRALAQAVARKRRRYPELLAARSRCKLLVFAIEVGGRWGPEAQRLLRQLARQRAQEAPAWLCRAASAGWQLRWSAIAAVAAQRALATSLLELPTHGDTLGGHAPDLPDLLADTGYEVPGGTLPATRLLKRETGPAPNTGCIPRAQKHRQKKVRKKKETEEHGSFDPFKSLNFQRIQVCSRPKAMSAFCFYMWMMSCA